MGKKRKERVMGNIGRLAMLWRPFDAKMVLRGVRADDTIVRGGDMEAALNSFWGAKFQGESIDRQMAQKCLGDWAVPLVGAKIKLPNVAIMQQTIDKMKHSAAGPDGVPYAIWKNVSTAAETMLRILEELCCGGVPPISFNESRICFIPKGEDDADHIEFIRRPGDCRPIGLKNTNNKLVCACANEVLKPCLTSSIVGNQRGFVAK